MLTSINNTFFNRNIATTKMKNRNDMVSTKVAQLVEKKKIQYDTHGHTYVAAICSELVIS